eukprot:Rhum_TRINITY_DN16652_c0_g1::Rhum_TRINITY_DN16652_c0_g1_i1::g.163908::m.163908
MIRSKSSFSCRACSANRRSFSRFCDSRAMARSALIAVTRSWPAFSLARCSRSFASCARRARSASSSACLSCAFSCRERRRAISRSFSVFTRSCSSASACSRVSFSFKYSEMWRSSACSISRCLFFRRICSAFANATSSISRFAADFFLRASWASSAFMRSMWRSIASCSCCFSSSLLSRSCSRSSICARMTAAPMRRFSMRFCSRSSYILRAFRRSFSMAMSRRASSSACSARMADFSAICASRIVTHFVYSMILFMCLTSSSSSSSFTCALESVSPFAASSAVSSEGFATPFARRASSMRRIFAFRSCAMAAARAFSSVTEAPICLSRSDACTMRCQLRSSEAVMTTVLSAGAPYSDTTFFFSWPSLTAGLLRRPAGPALLAAAVPSICLRRA